MIALLAVWALATQVSDTTVYGAADVQERPQLVSAPVSNYRRCLLDAGIRGSEGLEFVIDTAGDVERGSVSVIQSADPILDSLAVASLRAETFRPARRGGRTVRVRVQQPFRYGVNEAAAAQGDSGVFPASCLDSRPGLVNFVPPAPPDIAVDRGDTGTVVLSFRVDTTGHVDRKSVTVLSPRGEFDRAATTMLASDRTVFVPGRIYGRPVVAQVHLSVVFARGDCRAGGPPRRGPGPDPDAIEAIVVKACLN